MMYDLSLNFENSMTMQCKVVNNPDVNALAMHYEHQEIQ